ncbi:ester cyclase [Ferdinandcohnia sp. Marseille-Q9671]
MYSSTTGYTFSCLKGLVDFDALPSFRMPIQSIIAEGDQVAAYFIFEGTNTGISFFGVPATGITVK